MSDPTAPADRPRWQELLDLSRQLFAQPTVTDQHHLIVEATARMMGAQAELWLAGTTLVGAVGARGHAPQPSHTPPSDLMRQAFESRQGYTDGASPDAVRGVAMPLLTQDHVLGVLEVRRTCGPPFSDVEIELLNALAAQSAIALHASHQAARERRRADQFSALAEVSRAVASILDLDVLFREVVTIIHRQFGYPFVHLYTVDSVRQQIVYRAGSGLRSQGMQERGMRYDWNNPEGIIPWVARHGETVLANDVTAEPRYVPSELPPANTRAELAVPLVFGSQVLGVLDVQSDLRDAFGDDDRKLFEALADSVAIAIRNANLYRSERWRRQVADSLREVAGLLSAEATLEEVLNAILVELERNLPCDVAAVWLLDEDPSTSSGQAPSTPHQNRGSGQSLHVAAVRGADVDMEALDVALAIGLCPDASSWAKQALNADQPTIRSLQPPVGAQTGLGTVHPPTADPLAEALGFPQEHSAIAAPLRAGNQRLGLLTLAHRSPGRYGAESQAVMPTFAGYAAVAIENTRLYQESQEQALISTVMLRVAEAAQSLATLDQVLEAIAQLTSTLAEVNRCAILLWDNAAMAFVSAAAYGLDPAQRSAFEQCHVALGDIPAFDELYQNRAPIVTYDVASDPRLARTAVSAIGLESLLILPLLSQGEVLGAMLIECQDDLLIGTAETLLDERLVILQGIAHQTAAAVENAHLREAQQAEAYVSAALLQVSQAVTSLNTLDDILSAIVRIAPILVGVERCIIFLWEEERSAFRLAQAYGIARGAEAAARQYATGDFPLLDAVRDRGSTIVHSYGTSPDKDEMVPPDLAAPPRNQEGGEPRSLLAVPLSVKGEVLGVMLADTGPRSAWGKASTRHSSREKRLEIITGIAHQAAMAVQSERFQQERLGRERLERELQLAREIQQIFIPSELPRPHGWELAALWRAARQVAGDFYDLFELPDRRLGVIVADVADKGMPAALFMALTRTLMRAAAAEAISPAVVLARVNDLLVPDARHGMFVTAAYAVLSLETGELSYANAGHCLPLLSRSRSRTPEPLPKGGTALGVMAGIRLEEHTTILEPGDCLVFYTDGVTEALSPEGEFYGEERLQDVIQATEERSAQAMLEAIHNSVRLFSVDAPLPDDLTLVVLRRTDERAGLAG